MSQVNKGKQVRRKSYKTIAEAITYKEKQIEELLALRKDEIYSALKIGGAADVDVRLLAGFARYVATTKSSEDAIIATLQEKAKELDEPASNGK